MLSGGINDSAISFNPEFETGRLTQPTRNKQSRQLTIERIILRPLVF
jgi:hypothetical protein